MNIIKSSNGRVLEVKTSPGHRYIRVATVEGGIRRAKTVWNKDGKPIEYIFIFPVNELAEESTEALEKFREENRDVKIAWYDRQSFENLLEKTGLCTNEIIIEFIKETPEVMKQIKK